MPKYRKNPVVIEAFQFTEKTKDQIFNWVRGCNTFPDFDEQGNSVLRIQTLRGVMVAHIGDWVIKGEGEFYTCKPDIFDASYSLDITDEAVKGTTYDLDD